MELFDKILLLDGGMGTMLQGVLAPGAAPENLNITDPDAVRRVHEAYVAAGSRIVSANTFGANRHKYRGGYALSDVIRRGVEIAKASGAPLVGLDVGSTGAMLRPLGEMTVEEAIDIFREQIAIGTEAGADLVLIETMTDLLEAKAALIAAKEVTDRPVFVTMSFQQNGRTFLGTDAASAAVTLSSLGADAVGVNCSLGPRELLPVVETFLKYASVPVLVQPNAGLPQLIDGQTVYSVPPTEFADAVDEMIAMGVSAVGGCCGTTPDYIRELSRRIAGKPPVPCEKFTGAAVSSAAKCICLDGRVTVIGERINPTGKKKLKEALRTGDLDYVVGEALSQKNAGADVLDVNAGLPEIDEKTVLSSMIDEIQSVTDLPLQIDSSDPAAVEAAARRYRGKPIVNSVTGKAESLDTVLPIVKKYGAAVVGLTLDENGIPPTAEGRLAIAERIVERAAAYGIPAHDVLIDTLVLTASTNQDMVQETVRAVSLVKEKLGVKTVLGVSNVSFGLPARELLNRTFLACALGAGLDLPILNPLSAAYMDTVDAFRVLQGEDKQARGFIARHADAPAETPTGETADLRTLVLSGQRGGVREQVRRLLGEQSALEIINGRLIPALNEVGEKFEQGIFFLPQLIASAQAAREGFDELSAASPDSGKKGEKILLATVKGDIHDIGKNIVKMLLQNYGYEVVDLGKDVPPETIAETAKAQQIRLVGLSALMTTTVPYMDETVRALRKATQCKVMIGGAVVTQADADRMQADYYAKDAAEAARIAEEVFKGSNICG